MRRDMKALADGLIEVVKGYVQRAADVLSARVDAVEEQFRALPAPKDGVNGKDGTDGRDGRDAVSVDPEVIIAGVLRRIPAPDPGADGKDGRDGVDGRDAPVVDADAVVNAVLAKMPAPVAGQDGKDGEDGQDGRDAASVDAEAVIAAVLAQIPTPAAGRNGEDGRDGTDGKSFTLDEAKALLESEMAKWALDFERRAQDTLQRTIDRLPKPRDGVDGTNGSDGADALGFDDLTVEHDGERSFALKFVSGDRVKEFTFTIPVVLDKGFFREGDAFEKGDGVTFGGSYWIAQSTTRSKPETGNLDWRLAVKKGRDGKSSVELGK